MALNGKLARRVVQLLAHILANTLELATTLALCVVRLMGNHGSGQFRRQSGTPRLLLGAGCTGSYRGLGRQLRLNGGDIRIDQFIQQAGLVRVQRFAAAAEPVALQDSQLVGELLVQGLLVPDRLILAFYLRYQVCSLLQQLCGEGTKLVGGKLIEVGR
jgi:hypothetical protein